MVPKAFKFVTIYFPMFWLFVIIAETRRFWFCLGAFICLSWRLRILIVFLGGDSSRVRENWFARLTINKSRVDVLVLFTRRDKSWFNPLINIVKSYLGVINIWRNTRIFFKNNLKSIIIIMNRLIRFLCTSLNFIPRSRLWKGPRNCSMTSPSDCPRLIIY